MRELMNEIGNQTSESYGYFAVEHFQLVAADGIELSLTHIKGNEGKPPLVMLHGSYSTRHFWISPKGIGLGAFLHQQGYDVWIPEFRGHGRSPKGANFKQYSAEQQMQFDLPAFGAFVYQQTSQAAIWLGHSFGGINLYGSLSQAWLKKQYVKALITLGSQVSEGDDYLKYPLMPFLSRQLLKVLGKFPAKRLGLGPENEAPGVILDVINWKKRGGSWQTSTGHCFWKGFSQITQPCLVISSKGDTTDPADGCEYLYHQLPSKRKQFVLLSTEAGYAKDYDHVGMIIDKSAQQEVWPLIDRWIAAEVNVKKQIKSIKKSNTSKTTSLY